MQIYTIPGKEYDSNIYLIIGKIPSLIDTGTGFYSKEILHTIRKYIELSQLKQILLTHEHYDHVGGVQDFIKATQETVKVFAYKEVVEKLESGKSTFAEMLGGQMPHIKVDTPLSGGEHIILGDEPFEILSTPGHSIGSMCFYGKKSKTLFSGDTIFAHGDFGRYDFPGGDLNQLLHSIERLSKLDVQNLYPGHGPIIELSGKDHVIKALRSIQSLV